MREIEFRGKRVDNGEYIYGDLLTGGNEFVIINDTLRAMVEPNSVAQLVGRDANGKKFTRATSCLTTTNYSATSGRRI